MRGEGELRMRGEERKDREERGDKRETKRGAKREGAKRGAKSSTQGARRHRWSLAAQSRQPKEKRSRKFQQQQQQQQQHQLPSLCCHGTRVTQATTRGRRPIEHAPRHR